MSINDIETCLSNYYTDGIIMSEDCIKEVFDCLEELKVFRELYSNTDIKSSLATNYNNGWNDAIDRVWDWITEETQVEMHGVHWGELEKEIMGLKIPYFKFNE